MRFGMTMKLAALSALVITGLYLAFSTGVEPNLPPCSKYAVACGR